jgi:hypothetical protein
MYLGGGTNMVRAIERLNLKEEEAFALLELCMTSTQQLNATSELALRKLANYCKDSHHSTPEVNEEEPRKAV